MVKHRLLFIVAFCSAKVALMFAAFAAPGATRIFRPVQEYQTLDGHAGGCAKVNCHGCGSSWTVSAMTWPSVPALEIVIVI